MRRVLLCVTLAALIGGVFPSGGLAQPTSPSGAAGGRDLRGIMADGVLRVAMTKFDIPPFHQRRPDGTLFGKDIDFVTKLALALNIKTKIVDDGRTFDDVVDDVASGRADIAVSKLSQTYRRVLNVRFSEPYVTLHHAFLFNRAMIAQEAKGAAPEEALRNFRGRIGSSAQAPMSTLQQRIFRQRRSSNFRAGTRRSRPCRIKKSTWCTETSSRCGGFSSSTPRSISDSARQSSPTKSRSFRLRSATPVPSCRSS
jgi:hypothetical protein